MCLRDNCLVLIYRSKTRIPDAKRLEMHLFDLRLRTYRFEFLSCMHDLLQNCASALLMDAILFNATSVNELLSSW